MFILESDNNVLAIQEAQIYVVSQQLLSEDCGRNRQSV